MTHILIVSAYASVRAGLHVLLDGAEDCVIVGAVQGAAELERLLPETPADVVLTQSDGAGDMTRLLDVLRGGETALVALGDDATDYRLLAASPLSGWAYLLKEADGAQIVAAVRAAAAGLVVVDRSLTPLLSPPPAFPSDGRVTEAPPGEALTPRESEVLQLMAQGLPNKIIAARLGISLHTVKFHVAAILAKLDATSRTEAVTLGARRGYVLL